MFNKLYEMGYSPIPVTFKGKNPTLQAWQKFCDTRATIEQIEAWNEELHKGKINIGLACGPASGVIVLDIDTDDKDFLNKFPPSPVRRRGQKGEARFFKYSPRISSQSFPLLDILSTGRQIVLPPSTHPAGMKYEWLTPDTLDSFDPKDLPVIDENELQAIIETLKSVKTKPIGRNNKLVDIVTAMRGRGEAEQDIIKDVYNWDLFYHSPRLFTDEFKANNESDAKNNAWKFVTSVTKSLIDKGIAKLSDINGQMIVEMSEGEIIEQAKKEAFKYKPYPKPRGIMGTFQELCDLKSAGNQDATGLGGSIALMAVLASNKFVTECRGLITCPNTYVINLGYSSFGKEMAQSIIHELLQDTELLGSGNYKSDVSFIMKLPKQQERLDVVDECSSILKAMGSKEGYASNMVELMSELYTKGSTKFGGQTTAKNGDRFGACFNPQVSFLGSTTPKGFKASVNKEVAAKGLLPRMLIFFQNDIGKYRGRKDRSKAKDLMKDIKIFTQYMVSIPKQRHPDFIPFSVEGVEDLPEGIKYSHTVIPMTEDSHELWLTWEEEYHNKKSIDPEGLESAFMGRFAEMIAKLALLDALSLKRSQIETDGLLWAKEVIETQWHNATMLYELAHAENYIQANSLKILNYIKSHGIIDRSKLLKNNSTIKSKELDEIIRTLEETDQIQCKKAKAPSGLGREKLYYEYKK